MKEMHNDEGKLFMKDATRKKGGKDQGSKSSLASDLDSTTVQFISFKSNYFQRDHETLDYNDHGLCVME